MSTPDDTWQPGPPKPGAAAAPLPPVAVPAGGWSGHQPGAPGALAPGSYGAGPIRYSVEPAYSRRNVAGLGRLATGAVLLFGLLAPWFVARAGERFVWTRAWSFEGWRIDDLVGFKALAVAAGVTAALSFLVVIWKPRFAGMAALAALGGMLVAAGSIYNIVAGWGTDSGLRVYGGPGLFLAAAGGLLIAIGGLRAAVTATA